MNVGTRQPTAILGASDAVWRRLWARYGRVETICASLHLHRDDVCIRLRAAGVNLKGRPRLDCSPVESPAHNAAQAPHGAQLLVPGLAIC